MGGDSKETSVPRDLVLEVIYCVTSAAFCLCVVVLKYIHKFFDILLLKTKPNSPLLARGLDTPQWSTPLRHYWELQAHGVQGFRSHWLGLVGHEAATEWSRGGMGPGG